MLRERADAGIRSGAISAAQADTPPAPPAQPAAALARPGPLQRPAADLSRRARRRSRATTPRTRRSRATGGTSPTRPTARSSRSRSSSARSRCCAPTSTAGRRSSSAPSRRGGSTGPDPPRPTTRRSPATARRVDLRDVGAATRTSPSATAGSATMLCDLSGHEATASTGRRRAGAGDSQSAYNPALAADGASSSTRPCATGARWSSAKRPAGATRVAVARDAGGRRPLRRPLRAGARRPTARGWPTRKRAGGWPATRARSRSVGAACATCARADVLVADRSGGTANHGASRPTGASSRTSRSTRRRARQPGLVLREVDSGRTLRIPTGGAAAGPGRRRRRRGGGLRRRSRRALARSARGTAATGPCRSSAARRAPRARSADGWSEGPSISGDGRRVAFASTAANLMPPSATTPAPIFVRDLAGQATRLVSDVSVAYAVGG